MFQHKFSSNTVESLYFELFFLDNNLQLLAVSVAVSVELATSSALYDFTSFCNKKKKKKHVTGSLILSRMLSHCRSCRLLMKAERMLEQMFSSSSSSSSLSIISARNLMVAARCSVLNPGESTECEPVLWSTRVCISPLPSIMVRGGCLDQLATHSLENETLVFVSNRQVTLFCLVLKKKPTTTVPKVRIYYCNHGDEQIACFDSNHNVARKLCYLLLINQLIH